MLSRSHRPDGGFTFVAQDVTEQTAAEALNVPVCSKATLERSRRERPGSPGAAARGIVRVRKSPVGY